MPLVIAGGAYLSGKVVEALVSTESLPKTILAMVGIDVGDKMIGEDLLDVVQGRDDKRANQVFAQISESRVGRCIRTAEYLYGVYAPGVHGGEAVDSDIYADDYLYDMTKDPHQLENVVAKLEYQGVKLRLREELLKCVQHLFVNYE